MIKALRAHATEIAAREAERTLGGLHLDDPKVERKVRAMSQAIVNKLLHSPTVELKKMANSHQGPDQIGLIRKLFGL